MGTGGKIWEGLAMFVILLVGFAFLIMYSVDISQSSMASLRLAGENSYFWIEGIVLSVFAWGHTFIGLK